MPLNSTAGLANSVKFAPVNVTVWPRTPFVGENPVITGALVVTVKLLLVM